MGLLSKILTENALESVCVCDLMLQKLVLCIPFLHRWGGKLGPAAPSTCPRALQQMVVLGHNLRLLDEAGSLAPAAPRTRNKDSQHMLIEPRGSFPDWQQAEKLVFTNSFIHCAWLAIFLGKKPDDA